MKMEEGKQPKLQLLEKMKLKNTKKMQIYANSKSLKKQKNKGNFCS